MLKPDIKVDPAQARCFRQCYGCGGEAFGTLVFGHVFETGRPGGNAHALSMCLTCMREVSRVTAEATETA